MIPSCVCVYVRMFLLPCSTPFRVLMKHLNLAFQYGGWVQLKKMLHKASAANVSRNRATHFCVRSGVVPAECPRTGIGKRLKPGGGRHPPVDSVRARVADSHPPGGRHGSASMGVPFGCHSDLGKKHESEICDESLT